MTTTPSDHAVTDETGPTSSTGASGPTSADVSVPQFSLHLIGPGDALTDLALALEQQVLDELDGQDGQTLTQALAPYRPATTFVCLVDDTRRRPAAVARLVRPSPTGLATTRDLTDIWRVTLPDASPHRGLGAREPTWDLASLVVHPDYRRGADRGLVVATMFQAILMFVSGAGGRWLTATLDLVVLDAIQRQCCSPFTAFRGPEPVRHSASPACLPVYCDLDGYRRTLRLVDPERHVVLFEGRGLEPFVHRDRPLEGSPRR